MTNQQAVANSKPVNEFRLVCAWCQTVLTVGAPGAKTSHGICQACVGRLMGKEPTYAQSPRDE